MCIRDRSWRRPVATRQLACARFFGGVPWAGLDHSHRPTRDRGLAPVGSGPNLASKQVEQQVSISSFVARRSSMPWPGKLRHRRNAGFGRYLGRQRGHRGVLERWAQA
eukprot:9642656-Alexandrium_andersonii.AAC.1